MPLPAAAILRLWQRWQRLRHGQGSEAHTGPKISKPSRHAISWLDDGGDDQDRDEDRVNQSKNSKNHYNSLHVTPLFAARIAEPADGVK